MTTKDAPRTISRTLWTAARTLYEAGAPVERICASFRIPPAALRAKALEEGWSSGASPADAAPPTTLSAELADAAAILPTALAAGSAAIARAAEAATRGDDAAADAAVKLGERLVRTASHLQRIAAASPAVSEHDEPEAARDGLLRRIAQALEGSRTARRAEVEALQQRGIDPREAWIWDADAGDWTWDPGRAMAAAVGAPPAMPAERGSEDEAS